MYGVKLKDFKNSRKTLSVKTADKKDILDATAINFMDKLLLLWDISAARRTPEAIIVGTDSSIENFTASSLLTPRSLAAVIVIPDLDVPGIIAIA